MCMIKPSIVLFSLCFAISACNQQKPDAQKFVSDQLQMICFEEAINGDKLEDYYQELTFKEMPKDQSDRVYSMLNAMASIDQITTVYMLKMDEIRKNLFKSVGEKSFVYGTSTTIVLRKEDPSKTERPLKFDFYKVEKTGNTDVLGADQPDAIQLKNSLTNFRNELAEYMANAFISNAVGKNQKFKAPNIASFEDFDELRSQVDDAMDFSKIADEDRKFIMDLFVKLSKHESQWKIIMTDNIPVLNAIDIVTSIQYEMLHARTLAFEHLRKRIGDKF